MPRSIELTASEQATLAKRRAGRRLARARVSWRPERVPSKGERRAVVKRESKAALVAAEAVIRSAGGYAVQHFSYLDAANLLQLGNAQTSWDAREALVRWFRSQAGQRQ